MNLSLDTAVMSRSLITSACLLSLILVMTCVSCDDEKLEASTVTFSGTIMNADFSRAANQKFEILVRTNPDFDVDTTIRVRILVSTDASGNYDLTVHTDGFPPIPFYTVAPLSKSMVSLEVANCQSRTLHQPVLLDEVNTMNARFGPATYLKVTFHKTAESTATGARYIQCNQFVDTTLEKPDVTFTVKLPYDIVPNPYPFSYIVFYGDFSAEPRLFDVVLQPYETVDIEIHY
jgi:hypothetical protein